jgi:hypothetical protein
MQLLVATLCISSTLNTGRLFVAADLPVACNQPDIVGVWRFHVGRFSREASRSRHVTHISHRNSDGNAESDSPRLGSGLSFGEVSSEGGRRLVSGELEEVSYGLGFPLFGKLDYI